MLILAMLMTGQTVPGPPGDEDVAVPRVTQQQRCVRGSDEIVVCGAQASQRLEPLAERPVEPILPTASVHLSGGKTLTAHAEASSNPTVDAPRAMVTLKVPF